MLRIDGTQKMTICKMGFSLYFTGYNINNLLNPIG